AAPSATLRCHRSGKPLQRPGPAFSLAEKIPRAGGQVVVTVDPARRPADLDRLDEVAVAQPEVQPRIVGRLVTPATGPLGDLPPATGLHDDPCADAVAVGLRALQPKGDEPSDVLAPVVEVG